MENRRYVLVGGKKSENLNKIYPKNISEPNKILHKYTNES